MVCARLIDGLSPTLPADLVFEPILISPLKNVPVVKTKDLQNIFKPLSRTTDLMAFFEISIFSSSKYLITDWLISSVYGVNIDILFIFPGNGKRIWADRNYNRRWN